MKKKNITANQHCVNGHFSIMSSQAVDGCRQRCIFTQSRTFTDNGNENGNEIISNDLAYLQSYSHLSHFTVNK